MPTYAFKCDKCGSEAERYFGFHDTHEVTCDCGQLMSKIITPTPAVFRGTGWGGQ